MQKNILAAAVSAAMLLVAGSATAQLPIDNESLKESGSSLLVGQDGVTIQTDQEFGPVLDALKNASGLKGYISALGTGNTLQIPVGGEIYADKKLQELFPTLEEMVPDAAGILKRIEQATKFTDAGSSLTFSDDVINRIGDDQHDPLLIGMNAGDVLVNSTTGTLTLDRTGSIDNTFVSGNAFGVIGGSTAVNLGILTDTQYAGHGVLDALETKVSNGGVSLTIADHANVGGLSAAGAAVALGGSASSTVNGDVTINISTDHLEGHNTSGAVVGVISGGMAVSTLDGEAKTEVTGTTNVTATNGVNVGIFGGGAALTTELQGIPSRLLGLTGEGSKFVEGILQGVLQGADETNRYAIGGNASAISKVVNLSLTDQSVSVAVAGGGLGVAWAGGGEGSSSNSYVETGDVNIKLGGDFAEENKVDLHTAASTVMGALGAALKNPSKDGILEALPAVTEAISQSQEEFRGAHVGTIGGSILVAGMPSTSAALAKAEGRTGNVKIDISGGYNIATLGGGMTIAYGVGKAEGTSASSTVESTKISITDGDSVLTMAGGFAFASGSNGYESAVQSTSIVKTGGIEMSNGSADGLFGGGLAIDDTGAAEANATAETTSVTISVSGGTVNKANMDPLLDIGEPGADEGNPSKRSYVYETADLTQKANIAITGGGIASGAKATAHTGSAVITLSGGTVDGTVLGGGLATLGGESNVDNVTITVSGADVKGDIYAGGAAGSKQNEEFDPSYKGGSAYVQNANINLYSGTVTGNLYAGGYVYEGVTSATATVGTDPEASGESNIAIYSTDVFQGNRIDGNRAAVANLTLAGGDFDMFREGTEGAAGVNTVIAAFDTVDVTGSLTGVDYEFGDKAETTFVGGPSQLVMGDDFAQGKVAVIGNEERTGFVGFDEVKTGGQYKVANGALGFGEDVAKKAADAYGEAGAKSALYLTGDVDLTGLTIHVGEAADNAVKIGTDGILIADASGSTEVTGEVSLSEKGVFFDNVGVNLGEGQTEQSVVFNTALGDPAFAWDNVLWVGETADGGKTYIFRAENVIGADPDAYNFYNDLGADDPLRTLISSKNYSGEESLRAGMNLAAAAGVQAAAVEGVNQGIDAATRRASLQRFYKDGVEGFAEVTGIYSKMGGSGDMNEIKLEMGGLVAGADYTTGDWTFGGLVNAGTGTVRGQGDNGGVKNEVDYYGFELYGAKRFGDFNLVGQMGYLATTNDLSDGNLGAEVDDLDADVWTIGVRGEMKYALSAKCFVVPYVGLNYLRVGTDGYTTNQGTKVDSADQNLFTMPIGAAFQGTIAASNGWNWTPSVDVAYVGSFGDRDVDVDTTSVSGTVGAVSMDVWSESVFRARVGLEASKDNFGLGFVAGGSFGSDDASGFFGQIRARYAF